MSMTSDVAANKIAAIIREIEANKDADLDRAKAENEVLAKELGKYTELCESYKKRIKQVTDDHTSVSGDLVKLKETSELALDKRTVELDKVKKELERVSGLFETQKKEFKDSVERWVADMNARAAEIIRLGKENKTLDGEVTILKEGYATLKADAARGLVEASEAKEIARMAYEEEIDNLKGQNDALNAKLRGKGPTEEATRALAKEAAEALRERTFQTWDRKKYLGLLGRLDEVSKG